MQELPDHIQLSQWPTPAKVVLTLFLVLIGFGYLSALGNLYHRHQMADGKEGLTFDDLRATFSGLEISADPSETAGAAPSRMLQMVQPGGDMRKNLTKGGPQAVRALEQWLKRGALEPEFNTKGLTQADDPSARSVIERYCLRCHNADDGEKADTPYGPDLFDTDYKMVYVYAAPGTAKKQQDTQAGDPESNKTGPHSVAQLALITHIHMLSIPVFTLVVAGLFLLTGVRPKLCGLLAPIPMAALVVDFTSWWLARVAEPVIYLIPVAGAVFGITLGIQIVTVLLSLWLRPAREKVSGRFS